MRDGEGESGLFLRPLALGYVVFPSKRKTHGSENTSGKSCRKLGAAWISSQKTPNTASLNMSYLKSKATFGADIGQLSISGVDCPCSLRHSFGDKSSRTMSSVAWGCLWQEVPSLPQLTRTVRSPCFWKPSYHRLYTKAAWGWVCGPAILGPGLSPWYLSLLDWSHLHLKISVMWGWLPAASHLFMQKWQLRLSVTIVHVLSVRRDKRIPLGGQMCLCWKNTEIARGLKIVTKRALALTP